MGMMLGGNSPTPGFTPRGRATAEVFGPTVMLWLSSAGPQDAAHYPNGLHLVRLANFAAGMHPAAYVETVSGKITTWRAQIPRAVFVCGNEPRLEVEHDGTDFPQYAAALRAAFPGILLANPPPRPENVADLTDAVAAAADVVVCHAYFERQHPGDATNPGLGAAYRHALDVANDPQAGTPKPVIVSEFNVVQTNCPIDWPDRNAQAARWLDQAEQDGVAGVCFYILDAEKKDETFDVGPEAAMEILARRQPTAIATNSLAFRERSRDTLQVMITTGAGGRPTPFLDDGVLDGALAACRDWNLDPAVLFAWTTSENNNATNISAELLTARNGAGIKYVGQPRAHDGSLAHPPVLAPPSERSAPYCVFDTWGDFFWVLARNIVTLLPGAFAAGDLNRIAWYYTLGNAGLPHADAGEEQLKTTIYKQFIAIPDGAAPAPVVTSAPMAAPAPPVPRRRFRIITPVDAPVVQGSLGEFSHGGKVPGFFAIDYGCPRGTPCRAAADGTVGVIYTGDSNPISLRTGPSIWIDHDCGYSTFSCHMSQIDVQPGDRVVQGQIIGLTGDPNVDGGYGVGAHLHWEIWDMKGHVRVMAEDLEAAGIMGPYDGEEPDMGVPIETGGLDDAELKRLWQTNSAKRDGEALRPIDYSPVSQIFKKWKTLYLAGEPIGVPLTQEESDPASGRVVQYFGGPGKITYFPDDDTVKVN